AALVAAVTKLALVLLGERRIAFKVSAGQVVEQHLELRIEEIPPAFLEMGKERRLVRKQMIMHLVEPVDFREPEIAAEQVRHRAALIPLAMEAPLAARSDEPIGAQRLEDQSQRVPLRLGGSR